MNMAILGKIVNGVGDALRHRIDFLHAPVPTAQMLRRARLVRRAIGGYGIVAVLVLILPACTDFKKDFLCRPEGHCVDAPDGGTGSE
jgi:hypothetical protein